MKPLNFAFNDNYDTIVKGYFDYKFRRKYRIALLRNLLNYAHKYEDLNIIGLLFVRMFFLGPLVS